VLNLAPTLTVVALKMWAYSPRNRKNWYFWYKICPKEVYPLKRFLQNLAWGVSPRSTPTLTIVVLKCGLTAPKIAKNANIL